MARILLVDDSVSARALLGIRLRDAGFEVEEIGSAAEAAALALSTGFEAIVTDLWMPEISGLQLCRLLRAERATAHIPVVLLTASEDRRSRFWAKHAGATAYVMKSEIEILLDLLTSLTENATPSKRSIPPPSVGSRGSVQERLSGLLDASLFESTMAGELRALAKKAGDLEAMFEDLVALASDVVTYRWLALATDVAGGPRMRLFVHAHSDRQEEALREARAAFAILPSPGRRKRDESDTIMIANKLPVDAEWSTPTIVVPIRFDAQDIGKVALAPSRRGASHDDRKLISLLRDELGGPLRMAALIAEARRLASVDTLTGLLNRRAFVERVEAAVKSDPSSTMSLILLDLDRFKAINDTLGHDAGDAILRGVAETLAQIARTADIVGRWGGEEFVVALAQTSEAGARVAAERVRRAIADATYTLPSGAAHKATASIGLATVDCESFNLEELLARADKAMYAAKNRGRNRVETA